nr:ABC transporter ATP-binding protein [uncultured Peptostreptococcus sp.]
MEVKNLTFSYTEGGKTILENISFKIKTGSITSILGANGCGKSTLFDLMTKNLKVNSGEILLNGRNISTMSQKDFARKVAIIHQYNRVSDGITVRQLVSYGRTPYQVMMKRHDEEDERMISWAIEATNLVDIQDRTVNSLSGGQKQRAWIAMALAQGTKFLFLDEPTTYLDIRYQIEVLELIDRLNKELGMTIVMVLHDINQAMYYSDRVIGLKDGNILVQGDPEKVISSHSVEQMFGVKLEVVEVNNKKLILTV